MGKYSDLSDMEVFKKVAEYDSRAMEELYERYTPLLYTIVKKIIGNTGESEKVLSDIYAIIWRKSDMFNFQTGNVYAWIVLLARNKAVDVMRRKRGADFESLEYNDEYENYYIIPQLAKRIDSLDLETALNIKPEIETALSKLTDTQKYVIHLAFYDGYTIQEISEKMKIPVETVRSKVMLALHNLRDNLLTGA